MPSMRLKLMSKCFVVASERVLRTSFTRYTSRLLFLWLPPPYPFAMYPALGLWGTLPSVVVTYWAIASIKDIGAQLEEPFFVLPLRHYSDGIFDAINQVNRNFKPIGRG